APADFVTEPRFHTAPPPTKGTSFVDPALAELKGEAESRGAKLRGGVTDAVRVEVFARAGKGVRDDVRAVGGTVLGAAGGVVLAEVPAGQLRALEERGDVAMLGVPPA